MKSTNYNQPIKIITAEPPSLQEYFSDMIKFRSLILVFAVQELKTMYAQTYFGMLWSVFRPLITLATFTIIFKYFFNVSTETPYYIFAFAGMIAWNFFSQITNSASVAIISKQDLVKKMYFPKLILPISKVLVAGVDFLVSLIIIFFMILFEGRFFGLHTLALPLFILLNIFCGLSIAFWMNSFNIRFRDLHQIIPAIIGIAIWITPVFYPTTIIPDGYEIFVYANPMAGIIKGYRFALLGEAFPEWQYWISIIVTFILSIVGAWYISQTEHQMVDYA